MADEQREELAWCLNHLVDPARAKKILADWDACRAERDALKAELAALREQKSVAWIARDEPGSSPYIYEKPPTWDQSQEQWDPADDSEFEELCELCLPLAILPGECRPIYLGDPLPKPEPPPPLKPTFRNDVLTVYEANGRTATAEHYPPYNEWTASAKGSLLTIGSGLTSRESAEREAQEYVRSGKA